MEALKVYLNQDMRRQIMSDGLEDAYLHNTVEATAELINTYGIQVFFEIIDADTYEQLRDYIFRIENVTTSRR